MIPQIKTSVAHIISNDHVNIPNNPAIIPNIDSKIDTIILLLGSVLFVRVYVYNVNI